MKTSTRPNGVIALTVEKYALGDEADQVIYWQSVPANERVAVVEILRQRMNGGSGATRSGLQRFCKTLRR